MFLDLIKIAHILPCLADPEKIRFIAYFEKNVSKVFPYLNAILDGAIYNHEGRTLTIKDVPGVFISDKKERRS